MVLQAAVSIHLLPVALFPDVMGLVDQGELSRPLDQEEIGLRVAAD